MGAAGPVQVHAGCRPEVLEGDVLAVGGRVVAVVVRVAAVVLPRQVHRVLVAASHPHGQATAAQPWTFWTLLLPLLLLLQVVVPGVGCGLGRQSFLWVTGAQGSTPPQRGGGRSWQHARTPTPVRSRGSAGAAAGSTQVRVSGAPRAVGSAAIDPWRRAAGTRVSPPPPGASASRAGASLTW